MSNETAAAILTQVYCEQSPGFQNGLGGHRESVDEKDGEMIVEIYGWFLNRLSD